MSNPQSVQNFVKSVSDKKGLRFAIDLHQALQAGRTDRDTRAALRSALRALGTTYDRMQ